MGSLCSADVTLVRSGRSDSGRSGRSGSGRSSRSGSGRSGPVPVGPVGPVPVGLVRFRSVRSVRFWSVLFFYMSNCRKLRNQTGNREPGSVNREPVGTGTGMNRNRSEPEPVCTVLYSTVQYCTVQDLLFVIKKSKKSKT